MFYGAISGRFSQTSLHEARRMVDAAECAVPTLLIRPILKRHVYVGKVKYNSFPPDYVTLGLSGDSQIEKSFC